MDPILVFCEQRDGLVKQAAWEALGAASRLTGQTRRPIVALVIGAGIAGIPSTLTAHGATRVFVADDEGLARYGSEPYAAVCARVAEECRPAAILMGATAMGKDLGPKLAARLRAPLLQDCVDLCMEDDGTVLATRPVYGGKLRAIVRTSRPSLQVCTLRPNAFAAVSARTGATVKPEPLPAPPVSDGVARVREVQRATGATRELTEASRIVSGGRGLKAPEHFTLVEGLAEALGAAVGASRAAVDAGWKPHAYQVGLTGKTVSPQLYIACGISGAIQHQAGMSSSRIIVAINNNPNAPIFKIATYGLVGDLFEIIPLLTEEVKRLKARQDQ